MILTPTTHLVYLVPEYERFALVKTFIGVACGFGPWPEDVLRRIEINLDWAAFWSTTSQEQGWLDVIQDNEFLALDLARRAMAWVTNPSLSQRERLLDDVRA